MSQRNYQAFLKAVKREQGATHKQAIATYNRVKERLGRAPIGADVKRHPRITKQEFEKALHKRKPREKEREREKPKREVGERERGGAGGGAAGGLAVNRINSIADYYEYLDMMDMYDFDEYNAGMDTGRKK